MSFSTTASWTTRPSNRSEPPVRSPSPSACSPRLPSCGCDLTGSVLDTCTLRLTEFGRGKYQGLDLRSNDLTTLRGVAHLAKVVIDRAQQAELAEALIAELDVTFADTLDDR